jgi:hypothetical protein
VEAVVGADIETVARLEVMKRNTDDGALHLRDSLDDALLEAVGRDRATALRRWRNRQQKCGQ